MSADGAGKVDPLADWSIRPRTLSPDGHLVGIALAGDTDRDIVMLDLSTRAAPEPLLASTAREIDPRVSADGKWIAYVSDESGRNEIYVRPFPEVTEGRWQVSTRGGLSPQWNPKGGELFYFEGSSLMAAKIEDDAPFRSGLPTRVVDGPYVGTAGGYGGFGVSPDGERFLLYREVSDPGQSSELILVLNWFAELERLAPRDQEAPAR
jgi:serine/threonine-protein kinase